MSASTATAAEASGTEDGATSTSIAACRDQFAQFVEAVFAEAPANSWVTLRSFYDDKPAGNEKPFQSRYVRLEEEGGLEYLIAEACRMAQTAAECARPVNLCPSLATYAKRGTARAEDLAAGLCLTVECDERAEKAKRTLSAILGAPSLTVASGGEWADPETGEVEPKLHLHWVLQEAAQTPADQKALRRLRALACDLVDADGTSKATVHPIRWPGSVHCKDKKNPRLCRILEDTGARIDLHEALAELEGLEALRENVERENAADDRTAGGDGKPLSDDLLEGCADRIPNDNLHWDEWNRLGMAFWRASSGSAEGFNAFDKWSKKAGKYDLEATRARWEHFASSPPEKIGAGTLIFLARKADPEFMRRPRGAHQEEAAPQPAWDVETGTEFGPFRLAVAEINGRFMVVQLGGSVVIATYQRDDTLDRENLYFVKPSDFKLKYSSRKYLVGYTQRGSELWRPLGEAWLESSLRREYDRAAMICHGDCPPDVLNLWCGWGAEPKEGDWETLAWHLLYIICGGNESHYEYLVFLLVRWVQNPERPGEVAIVLRGEKGTGKGTVADIIKRWFRHHYVHISQAKHLTGHFNAHLADCLFLFADEVVWGGDKQGEGVLKALVTERVVQIEPKGVKAIQMPNRLKILMASNNDWVVPVTAEERRYFVLDVLSQRLGDAAYFQRLHEAIASGEAEAMLYDLLRMDLSAFDHRNVPHTVGLNGQKMEGLDSVGRWWASCLQEGSIVGIPSSHDPIIGETSTPEWPTTMRKRKLHEAYVRHAREHGESHPRAENIFPQLWRAKYAPSIGESKPKGGARREWKFGTLVDHRAEFQRMMNIENWDWGDIDDVEADNVTSLRGGSRF